MFASDECLVRAVKPTSPSQPFVEHRAENNGHLVERRQQSIAEEQQARPAENDIEQHLRNPIDEAADHRHLRIDDRAEQVSHVRKNAFLFLICGMEGQKKARIANTSSGIAA